MPPQVARYPSYKGREPSLKSCKTQNLYWKWFEIKANLHLFAARSPGGSAEEAACYQRGRHQMRSGPTAAKFLRKRIEVRNLKFNLLTLLPRRIQFKKRSLFSQTDCLCLFERIRFLMDNGICGETNRRVEVGKLGGLWGHFRYQAKAEKRGPQCDQAETTLGSKIVSICTWIDQNLISCGF